MRVRFEPSSAPKHDAFPFQADAVRALKDLEFAAVFHEQGLGKTKIALDLALDWIRRGLVDSVIFVTKRALVSNWKREIASHTFFAPRILGQNRSANYYALNSPARFYVAHYEVFVSEEERLRAFLHTRRVAIICDEAQKFKNPASQIAKALFSLRPDFVRRVVMTGTPIANRPYDIWAPVFFLDGGLSLGSDYEKFRATYDLDKNLSDDSARREEFEQNLARLFGRIKGFSARETKKTAGIALPDKEILEVPVEISGLQEELYQRYLEETRAVVIRDGRPAEDNAAVIVKLLLRLIQVASNPCLVDESYSGEPAKLPVLRDLIRDAFNDPTAKVIVWTNFVANVQWLARQLQVYRPAMVHGSLSFERRAREIDRFETDTTCKVLIATPASAKEGLTLTMANHAIFFDRSLSLDDYLQAQDRIHRISQEKTCFVYNLVARNTVDEWVNELLLSKQHAASLGLGDVQLEQYRERAEYRYSEILTQILDQRIGGEHAGQ